MEYIIAVKGNTLTESDNAGEHLKNEDSPQFKMKDMIKMKLNKEEQEFIAKNITKFDVVTGITVNEIEVRVHGKHFGGVGSSAMYRTNDIKAIYAHTHAQCVEAEENLRLLQSTRVLTYEESMER